MSKFSETYMAMGGTDLLAWVWEVVDFYTLRTDRQRDYWHNSKLVDAE